MSRGTRRCISARAIRRPRIQDGVRRIIRAGQPATSGGVGYDWTDLYYNPNGTTSYGQIFEDGMGNPLSPGTYYIGVYDYTGATPLSYTILSHGIGGGYS